MKLVEVEYVFDGSRIVFYFTANGRVDFRELVRDLASVFRARIELRQIGVRDEAKMIGGLGPCGRPICCRQFLSDFQPVSIKMAKEQNLSLNPTKISGLCGRLMCCLKYEQDHYACVHKCMPRVGKEVQTPEGTGTVVDVGVLKEQLSVRVQKKDGWEIQHYPFDSLEPHEQGEPWVLRQVEPPQPEIDDFIIREEPIPRQPQPAQERAPERRRPRPPRPKREDEEARAAHGEPSPAAPAQGEDEQHARPPRRRGGRRKAGRGGQGGGKPPAAES